MRGRRYGALMAAFLISVGAASCAQNAGNDDPAATSDTRATSAECTEGGGKGAPIQWQNTTVDIEPASRFGERSDIANVTTTVAASSDDADDVASELDKLEDASVDRSEDGRMFQVRQQIDLEPVEGEKDQRRLRMRAPLEGTDLAKDGDVSLVVQLPRPSQGHDDVPTYDVELVRATQDEGVPEPVIYDGSDAVGRRITVAWHWCVDPITDIIYRLP